MSVLRIDNRVPYKYGWTNQNRIFFCIYLLARSSSCAGGQDMTRDNATRPDRQKPRRSFVSTTVCPTNTAEPIWTECFFYIYLLRRSSVRAGGQDVARDNSTGPGRHQDLLGLSCTLRTRLNRSGLNFLLYLLTAQVVGSRWWTRRGAR